MNIVIPMAGDGSRFAKAGFDLPKPFIDVRGTPMIERVISTLPKATTLILICRNEHLSQHGSFYEAIQKLHANIKLITTTGLTEGAACTVLLSKELINNDDELIIANSDQLVEYDQEQFNKLRASGPDGIIFTFKASHPKWSYVKLEDGCVVNVAEKLVISDDATCGIYYFKRGSDYVKSAERMMAKQIRVNNEFYNAPVFNEMIEDGQRIIPFQVNRMHGLGTPEDLTEYLNV